MCDFCKDMRNSDDVLPTELSISRVGEMMGREMYVVLGKNCYEHGKTGRYQIFTEFRIEGEDLDAVASINIRYCPMCGRKLD